MAIPSEKTKGRDSLIESDSTRPGVLLEALQAAAGGCPALGSTSQRSAAVHPSDVRPNSHFVALSKFAVANGMIAEVKHAFRSRPHKVDDADGFLRMEVISPMEDLNEIWLITFWRDEASYKAWHHSHLYRESHAGIPKGLKLVPQSVAIRFFEGVAS